MTVYEDMLKPRTAPDLRSWNVFVSSKQSALRKVILTVYMVLACCIPLFMLRTERLLDALKSRTVPDNDELPSRYHVPWDRIPLSTLPTMKASKTKILYSAYAMKSTDGLGHAIATFNAEIHTALSLGLTYSHRFAEFASLTRNDAMAVESFFGLGYGEISRQTLQETVCDIDKEYWDSFQVGRKRARVCPICSKLRNVSAEKRMVNSIAKLPAIDGMSAQKRARLQHLYSNASSTLFIMNATGCDKLNAYSDFSITAPVFYWKYWRLHGLNIKGDPLANDQAGSTREIRHIPYNDDELSISIHARRGDFLDPKNKRSPTSSAVFVTLVCEVLRLIRQSGGRLASLRPAVHIYSEGVIKSKPPGRGHDVANFEPRFIDIDGTEQSATWWQEQLFKSTLTEDGDERPPLPRVVMHMAKRTLPSLHEMASADIFIGSASGFSRNIIRSISRGVMVLPCSFQTPRRNPGTSRGLDLQCACSQWYF